MRHRVVIACIAAALSASAIAQSTNQTVKEPERIEVIPMAQCDLARAHATLAMEASYNGARIAEQQMKVLEQLRVLNDKAKDNEQPLGDQLSKSDIEKFGKLTQQLSAGQLVQLIDSKRERDLNVLVQQVKLADAEYRWGATPAEGSAEYTPYVFLLALRIMWHDKNAFVEPAPTPCSLDYALAKLQEEPTAKLNTMDPQIQRAAAWINQVRAKYNIKQQLDESKLSKGELATLQKYRAEVLDPGNRAANYARDLDNLRVMARASEVLYDSDRKDATIAAGDASVIGTTIQRRGDAGEFDDQMKQALGVWRKLNEQIPAPIVQAWDEESKAAQRAK